MKKVHLRKIFSTVLGIGLAASLTACQTNATQRPVTNAASGTTAQATKEQNTNQVTTSGQTEKSQTATTAQAGDKKTKLGKKSNPNYKDTFYFESNGIAFTTGEPAKEILEKLGKAEKQYEAPSCVFDGNDQVYSYKGFDVNVATVDGVEVVVGIFLTSQDSSTPEGLKKGDTAEQVKELYGQPDSDNMGQMSWKKGKVEFLVVMFEGKVETISYLGIFK